MKKYFVKYSYKKLSAIGAVLPCDYYDNKFFNTDDIELEWKRFLSFNTTRKFTLLDITLL